MLELSEELAPVHPAATVVLVREGDEGLEVLLVRRNQALAHMGGMWVFPGGRVDAADYCPPGDDYRAARNAAIRETREEAGLELEEDQLAYLSHWVTPEGAKRRYATWFFLAVLEDGQEVVVDGGEIAAHRWVRPAVAFAELADREHPFRLLPPTYVSLVELAECASCGEALARISAREAPHFAPRMVFVTNGICFLYEGDAGYEGLDLEASGPRHRTYMIDDQLEYIREY
ncbi:MAG: NUDIX hydrolase [Pseudomonadales bacterium]|nr:NUDIX hydrolase [Pseudomonadales bacterium]MCP5167265.1 NUDIX hydrolase [Pseudomonadales bacterium]MCP5187739.1 NUDIX hydrolase [Pseudomonadales bacterium]